MNDKLKPYTEFETKYRTEITVLGHFKRIVEALPDHSFIYVQGPDNYYTKPGSPFKRLRVGQYPMPNGEIFMQLTSKLKPDGARTNVQRREPNWTLTGNDLEEIKDGLDLDGYKFSFAIWKGCHIYEFKDATLVFYTVIEEGQTSEAHFIEIEVDEKTIHNLTEADAWNVISKYEKILAPVGISPQKRLLKSLFDMYHKKELPNLT